jgi:hypothetical protein
MHPVDARAFDACAHNVCADDASAFDARADVPPLDLSAAVLLST